MQPSPWLDPQSSQGRNRPRPQPQTTTGWYVQPSRLESLVAAYTPITLKQMDSVSLLNRTDTKFVLTQRQLLTALAALQYDYQALTVNGHPLNHYRTLYFDTPGFDLYHLHINERAERYKVRARQYADSGDCFLEVKHHTRKDRTLKERVPTEGPLLEMTPGALDWLQGCFPYDGGALQARLWNTFTRVTLVSRQRCERVTLDMDLAFYSDQHFVRLDGLAVAEVKMNAEHVLSPFLQQMRAQRVHPQGFSKYCLGAAMLYPGLKKNALKSKLLMIEKINLGANHHE